MNYEIESNGKFQLGFFLREDIYCMHPFLKGDRWLGY